MTTEPLHYFKSSYSNNGGNCVEVSADLVASHGVVPVRDSKAPELAPLMVSAAPFAAFVAMAKGL